MVPVYDSKLAAHVAAVNLANTIRNDLARPAYELWQRMLGKKVRKTSGYGGYTAAAVTMSSLLVLDHEAYGLCKGDCHLWLDSQSDSRVMYRLWVDVHYNYTTSAWGEREAEERQSHQRYETTLHVGEIRNQILTGVTVNVPFRTDYDVHSVLDARKQLKALEEQCHAVKASGSLSIFGEY